MKPTLALFSALAIVAMAACSAPQPETSSPGQPQGEVATDPAPAESETQPDSASGADDATVQPEWDALDRMQDTCGIRVVQGFLGQAASAIPVGRLPEQHRILAPTDQATMDYVPTRLNVLTDEEGMVIGFKCG